jgi:hypothetical protein
VKRVAIVVMALSARVAAADAPPPADAAQHVASAWRTAILAVPCDRKTPQSDVICSGASVAAMMPPPVTFAIDDDQGGASSCDTWSEKPHELAAVAAGDAYDLLATCISAELEEDGGAPIRATTYARIAKFLPRAARAPMKALAKTHRFVLIEHKPTSGDPGRFQAVLAIRAGASGTPEIAAVIVRKRHEQIDGE